MRPKAKALGYLDAQAIATAGTTANTKRGTEEAKVEDETQKGGGFSFWAGGFGGFVFSVFDGPAGGVLGAAFDPPAIEEGERGDAVEGGLHAGGAGGLVGAARGVDPDVDALGQESAEFPVVVFDVVDLER